MTTSAAVSAATSAATSTSTTSATSDVVVAWQPEQVELAEWQPCVDWPGISQKVLSSTPIAIAGRLRLDPGAGEDLHVHRLGEHHVWVLSGAVRAGNVELSAGSYLRVGAGVPHRLVDTGSGSELLFVRIQPG